MEEAGSRSAGTGDKKHWLFTTLRVALQQSLGNHQEVLTERELGYQTGPSRLHVGSVNLRPPTRSSIIFQIIRNSF